jgi:hypothetical protein
MMNLIERLEISKNEERPSYASVLTGSPASSPSSVKSYEGSVLTEDHSSHDEPANEAVVPVPVKSVEHVLPQTKKSLKKCSPKREQNDEGLLRTVGYGYYFGFEAYSICHFHGAGKVDHTATRRVTTSHDNGSIRRFPYREETAHILGGTLVCSIRGG